jgi:hypothetical protein
VIKKIVVVGSTGLNYSVLNTDGTTSTGTLTLR